MVAFNSNRPDPVKSPYGLFVRASNSAGQDEPLVKSETSISSPDWSRDGRFVVYNNAPAPNTNDLWTIAITGDRKPTPFLDTQYNETNPVFSPNGRWIAYQSNTTGRNEIFVRPFPRRKGLFNISRDGGWSPQWRGDGRELFFLSLEGTMMSVGIDPAQGAAVGVPKPLFETGLRPENAHPYAVTRDGQRFLVPIPHDAPGRRQLNVVVNWPALLAR